MSSQAITTTLAGIAAAAVVAACVLVARGQPPPPPAIAPPAAAQPDPAIVATLGDLDRRMAAIERDVSVLTARPVPIDAEALRRQLGQGDRGPGRGGDRGPGPGGWQPPDPQAIASQFAADQHLDAALGAQLAALLASQRQEMMALFAEGRNGGDRNAIREKMATLRQAHAEALGRLLSPEQVAVLQERLGPMGRGDRGNRGNRGERGDRQPGADQPAAGPAAGPFGEDPAPPPSGPAPTEAAPPPAP